VDRHGHRTRRRARFKGTNRIGKTSWSTKPAVTTVRKTFSGKPTTSDGPFAETKEQLGGYYLIKAKDLDEALALAAEIPIPVASLEVRPVAFRPDAG
jgi:hypothetical protein